MIKRLLNKSDFIKNSFVLILGTGLAQLIPVILQFPLRKFFTPEEFGTFAVYYGIVSVLAILANFRYSTTIVIPKEDGDGLNLLAGSIILSLVFSLLTFVFFLIFGEFIINYFEFPQALKKWILLIPLSIFLVSSHLSLSYWLTRKKRFKGLAFNKVSRRTSEGISHYLFGFFKTNGGLVWGTLIGDLFNFFTYLFQVKRSVIDFKSISFNNIKIQLKRYIDFPKYSLIPSFLDAFSLALPVFIITSLYSEKITGQYDLTVKILSVPLALISLAISQVLIQKISELKNNQKRVLPAIKNTFIGLLGLSIIGIVIFHFFGKNIFTFAFGEEWELAGQLSEVLVFAYGIRFIVSPLTSTFIALEKVKISSIWQICYFLVVFSLYLFDGITIEKFILYYMLIDVTSYLIYAGLIFKISYNYDLKNFNA